MAVDFLALLVPFASDYLIGAPDALRYGGWKLFPYLFFTVDFLINCPLSTDFLRESDLYELSTTLIFPPAFEILIKFSKLVLLSSPSKQISSRRSLITGSGRPFC